jgi:hypothetical protein
LSLIEWIYLAAVNELSAHNKAPYQT